jgi:hypothetical protein
MSQEDAMYYSTWYLAYILFRLQKIYGTEFGIQMGVPTDSDHYDDAKEIAVRVLASAYRLVENVFNNDHKAFLACDVDSLKQKTEIVPYSVDIKNEYNILVFPEAYACLKPLTNRGRIANGMNLMVDIGGGTTDISFFTIEKNLPQVYDFFSIDKGLNYLTNALKDERPHHLSDLSTPHETHPHSILHEVRSMIDRYALHSLHNINVPRDSNVHSSDALDPERVNTYIAEVKTKCDSLLQDLRYEFSQTSISLARLDEALKNRPLIYTGGGSTFKRLQVGYNGFQDKKIISFREWDVRAIDDIQKIVNLGLCPILSTSYGLAISVASDDIRRTPFSDIFDGFNNGDDDPDNDSGGDLPYDLIDT